MLPSADPSRIEEIERFLREEVFQGLKMAPGSICRIASRYLENWGIRVTAENRKKIEARAITSNLQDWEGDSARLHDAIEAAIDKAGLSAGNKDMNGVLATLAVPIIGEMLKHHPEGLDILDLGAGNGDTTITLLDVMGSRPDTEGLAGKCRFYLLEPSYRKAGDLGRRLETHPLRPNSTIVVSSLENHLHAVQDGHFHMTVSNAVLHHMSTPSYLTALHRKLADDGVLVVGDWYTTIWSRPEFLVPVIRALGADEMRVTRFENKFGISRSRNVQPNGCITEQQRTANTYMVDYIRCLAVELQSVTDGSRQQLFEAHQALPDHHKDVTEAGFELHLSDLKAKHKAFVKCNANVVKLYQNMDIACVWAAGKIPRKAAGQAKARNR